MRTLRQCGEPPAVRTTLVDGTTATNVPRCMFCVPNASKSYFHYNFIAPDDVAIHLIPMPGVA